MSNTLADSISAPFSRRGFLKGLGAVSATAALASCGGSGKGAQSLFTDNPANVGVPPINGVVVAGGAPHNCGGRCVTKAYVENGVVKRLVTDENTDQNILDGTGDNPQRRACVRCRSHKGFMYRSDRLLKPLKQMGNRGDPSGFVEITWDQAFSEIAQKLQSIQTTYGSESMYAHYASGDGASVPRAGGSGAGAIQQRLLNLMGGFILYRNDYSYPALEHTAVFCLGTDMGTPSTSPTQDCLNAEQIVLWAKNSLEMIDNTGTGWYLTQARDKGIPIIAIDNRVSQTMATVATTQYGIVTGTDSAMLLAMMYHLVAEPSLDGTKAAGTLLDFPFIEKYVHGFFDDPTPSLYHADVQSTGKYVVPAGASLSAFILGNSRFLVDNVVQGKPWNQAPSIYPYDIGFNVNADDVLAGKRVPIWGQTPKTPEWAEKICGIPAATIRALAESFVNKKTHFWIGGGWQRNMESEQPLMLSYTLGAITKNWGVNGRMFGMPTAKTSAGSLNMTVIANAVNVQSKIYDTSKLTSPTYSSTVTRNSFPVFLWPDLAKNGGTGKSDWNDAQIKNLKPIKALLNFAGNCLVNQTGYAAYVKPILADKSKVELIVGADLYMTASAVYCDYLLPAAAAFEKTAATAGQECLIYMGKAVEPAGATKSDYDIATGIADKLGIKDKFTEGRTEEDWVHWAWDQNKITSMTYDAWKQGGIYVSNNTSTPAAKWAAYLASPTAAPLKTPSGKFECFAQAQVEDYVARGYNNVDAAATGSDPTTTGSKLTGPLYDGSDAARFVYPIPMYIPLVEGRHANEDPGTGIPHPDPLGLRSKGYTLMLQTWHMQYRSHSTHGSNAFLNECYKKDASGQPAFFSPKRSRGNVWDAGIYEPVWINPATAQQFGISDGDRVLVSNDRGRIYASAKVTQRAQPYFVHMGQGAWHQLDGNGVDVGGCPNTLTNARPSRICQGMTLASGTLVKIEKA